ncbi:NupC/NupG family nucleoside CNT transporter [Aridibaculum aurantiacum]|uniref:NupC/NupG family nucleoside CNT transporter n=1 Tax=Aridibaculum aurantiacum TaxID=2810307 RepID=UPI001A95AF11|nr:nucleoside transporter C-terminal domain-containing protein [Aridibaculum aurantiacum]
MNAENILRGIGGILFLVLVCFLISNNRRRINWKLVGIGLLVQLIIAISIKNIGFVGGTFSFLANAFVKVINLGKEGAAFIFGRQLLDPTQNWGFIFAVQALPNIIFFAALSALLYYMGVLQKIVFVFAWILSRMGVSGPESISAAANVFLGQTEAPLMAKPYLANMNKSEILCIMIGGMATTAGSVLATYVGMLGGTDVAQQQYFALQLLTASVMAAPASIVIAKIIYPDPEGAVKSTKVGVSKEKIGSNVLDAISNGTIDGLKLAVNVAAMLIAFTALMAVLNYLLVYMGGINNFFGMSFKSLNAQIADATGGRYAGLSLQFILGYLFAPIAWLIGVESADITYFGQLLGEKTILNEFFAYDSLGKLKAANAFSSSKTVVMASFALCGFANFASIGIQIGGIGALAPNQRTNLSSLGMKALIGGTIASLTNACIAGMLM